MLAFGNKILTVNSKGLEFNEVKTVRIGNLIWMAENLSVDDGQGGIKLYDAIDENGNNLGPNYYYSWDAAMRVAANYGSGWRLPTVADIDSLTSIYPMAKSLKSTFGWTPSEDPDLGNGNNESGFNAIPYGWADDNGDGTGVNHYTVGSWARYWTSEASWTEGWKRMLTLNDRDAGSGGYSEEHTGYKQLVRLVKDA